MVGDGRQEGGQREGRLHEDCQGRRLKCRGGMRRPPQQGASALAQRALAGGWGKGSQRQESLKVVAAHKCNEDGRAEGMSEGIWMGVDSLEVCFHPGGGEVIARIHCPLPATHAREPEMIGNGDGAVNEQFHLPSGPIQIRRVGDSHDGPLEYCGQSAEVSQSHPATGRSSPSARAEPRADQILEYLEAGGWACAVEEGVK